MSRIRMILLATCSVVALMTFDSALQAQAPGGPGGPGGQSGPGGRRGGFPGGFGRNSSYRSLLARSEVQKELKLTDQQKTQLEQVNTQLDQQRHQQRDALRNNNNAGGPPDPEAMRAAFTTMQQQSDQAISKILTTSQSKRLQEISLQQQGPMAVATNSSVQTVLNMSPDQIAQVQMIMDESNQARRQSFQSMGAMFQQFRESGLDREAIRGKMQTPEVRSQMDRMRKQQDDLQRQTIQQIARVLTKNQKAKFNKMLGEPFDLPPRNGPGGPGGPGAAANPTPTNNTNTASASGSTTPSQSARNRRGTAQ